MTRVTYNLDAGGENTPITLANSGAAVVAPGTGGTAVYAAAAAASVRTVLA
jgi:uncharacterized protein RhaS with RHS repeats